MNRRLWTFLVVGLCLVPSLAGVAQEAKTLIVGIEADVMTLDPGNHRDRTTQNVIRNMFDGLVTRTPAMEVVPELAVSWERISDTEWVFHLRDGVTWHDGVPFTAEDVEFTVDRTVKEGRIGGRTSPRKSLLDPVIGAEVVDRLTVKIITAVPFPALLAFLPFHEIVPKHYVEAVGDAYFAENPIGTGPFRFVRWDKGVQVVMERYDGYYGGSPDIPPVGPAKLDRVIFRVLPETSTRIAALRAGEIHIATRIPVDLIPEIEAGPNLLVMSVRGTRSTFLEMNVTQPPFDDVRVRRAMNYAIDVNKIIEHVLGGLATPIPSLLSPDSPYFKDLEPYGYDPEKAKALLAEAGYPHGFSVTIDCEDYLKDVALVCAQMLREIGIDARVQVWERGILRTKLLNRERAMWIGDWGNATLDPMDIMIPKLRTGERGNYTGYSSCLYDGLMEFAERIARDPTSRTAAYHIAQELIHHEAPMVFLYVAEELYGVSRRVIGWQPSPDSRINLHDVDLGQ
ncbi:MAG: ABC transporter substrate-binding protein [Candidatus Acetothermia bacterium]|jgi:peptide/nickel transport system substrate-binding protein|nr:ABC transporter substrate-binding protein [Candidatus Acetothermia bacterium]